jgi:hypothetical protein
MRMRKIGLSTSRCMIILQCSGFAQLLIARSLKARGKGAPKKKRTAGGMWIGTPCFGWVLTVVLQSRRRAESGRFGLHQWMQLYRILHICRNTGVSGNIREYILSRIPSKKPERNPIQKPKILQTIRYMCILISQGLRYWLVYVWQIPCKMFIQEGVPS